MHSLHVNRTHCRVLLSFVRSSKLESNPTRVIDLPPKCESRAESKRAKLDSSRVWARLEPDEIEKVDPNRSRVVRVLCNLILIFSISAHCFSMMFHFAPAKVTMSVSICLRRCFVSLPWESATLRSFLCTVFHPIGGPVDFSFFRVPKPAR